VGRKFLYINNLEANLGRNPIHHLQTQITVVIVIDSVELVVLQQAQKMWTLDRSQTIRFQQTGNPSKKIIDIVPMGQNIICHNEIRPLELLNQIKPKKRSRLESPVKRAASAVALVGSIYKHEIPPF